MLIYSKVIITINEIKTISIKCSLFPALDWNPCRKMQCDLDFSINWTLVSIGWEIMKLFQSVLRSYKLLGIEMSLKHESNSLSLKSLLILLTSIQAMVSSAAFFLFEAQTVSEYGYSFYTSTTVFFNTGYFLIKIWKMPAIFGFINGLEDFIKKSKPSYGFEVHWKRKKTWFLWTILGLDISTSRYMYSKMNEKIEMVSQILHFAFVKVTLPGLMVPFFVISAVNYLMYDLKDESFQLPYPVMYVQLFA